MMMWRMLITLAEEGLDRICFTIFTNLWWVVPVILVSWYFIDSITDGRFYERGLRKRRMRSMRKRYVKVDKLPFE